MDSSGHSKIPNFSGIKNVETLQQLAADLSRRLENANNTVEAQRRVAKNSIATAEKCRRNLVQVSTTLRLEMAKNESQRRQKLKEDEANNFETAKRKRKMIQDKLRLAELDYQIQPSLRASQRIDKMKGDIKLIRLNLETYNINEQCMHHHSCYPLSDISTIHNFELFAVQLVSIEMNQESQKRLLTHLVTIEKMTEDLSSAAQCGDFNACTALLRQGAGLNDTDSSGRAYILIEYY